MVVNSKPADVDVDEDAETAEVRTFLLIRNPGRSPEDPVKRSEEVAATASGRKVKGQWSTGNRKKGMAVGDRVFLLQQGDGVRGVVAAGYVRSPVFQEPHWDYPGEQGNYVKVHWNVVLEDEGALPTEQLQFQIPDFSWRLQSGGVLAPGDIAEQLEALWGAHLESGYGGPGWWTDRDRRTQIEDHAHAMMAEHYRDKGWDVVDARQGNPFDAIATKGGRTLYLKAKGTQTSGAHVMVTAGEVEWACTHFSHIGIVSDIRFLPDGGLDTNSGSLRVYDWSPAEDELTPIQYQWTLPPDTLSRNIKRVWALDTVKGIKLVKPPRNPW